MAHSCPICSSGCHCGGDIDDIYFEDTPEQANCRCCNNDDEKELIDPDDYPEGFFIDINNNF